VASFGNCLASSLLVYFSNSGAFIATAFADFTVAVWDPNVRREHLKDVNAHTDKITCLEFSPYNTLLASGARDYTAQIWSLCTAQRLHRLVAHEGPVTVLGFTPDSQRLCSGSEDHLLILWDVKHSKVVRGINRGAVCVRFPRGTTNQFAQFAVSLGLRRQCFL
jgi:WD40 repeat protein